VHSETMFSTNGKGLNRRLHTYQIHNIAINRHIAF